MLDGKDGLEVYGFSVYVSNWSKPIFFQLGFCTHGEQQTDATFPIYFGVFTVLGAII